jgi:hypothetical protein
LGVGVAVAMLQENVDGGLRGCTLEREREGTKNGGLGTSVPDRIVAMDDRMVWLRRAIVAAWRHF